MVVPCSHPRSPPFAKFFYRGILLINIIMLRSGEAYVSVVPRAALRLYNSAPRRRSSSCCRRRRRRRTLRRNNNKCHRCYPQQDTATGYPLARNPATTTGRLKASAADNPDTDDSAAVAAPSLQRYHDLSNRVDRVFCLSDLHTDHVDNLQWLRHRLQNPSSSLSNSAKRTNLNERDLVIVAGDISNDVSTFRESLDLLLEHCQVLFVPGNHEAWLSHKERQMPGVSSLDKLHYFYQLCRERGAYVDPVYIGGSGIGDRVVPPLWILPLESWYDGTLSFDEELCQGFGA